MQGGGRIRSTILFPEISFFFIYENLNFWSKFQFLTKILIFERNLNFSKKIQFVNKSSIFQPNFNVSPKFQFLNKIYQPYTFEKILKCKNLHKYTVGIFLTKFQFFTTFLIFDTNFSFSIFLFSIQISIFWNSIFD